MDLLPTVDDARATIPIQPAQPTPLYATVIPVYDESGVQTHSALARLWEAGAIPGCRLCSRGRCVATGPMCHMLVAGIVTPEEAYFFRDADCRWLAQSQVKTSQIS